MNTDLFALSAYFIAVSQSSVCTLSFELFDPTTLLTDTSLVKVRISGIMRYLNEKPFTKMLKIKVISDDDSSNNAFTNEF